jgi:hypothetical protein
MAVLAAHVCCVAERLLQARGFARQPPQPLPPQPNSKRYASGVEYRCTVNCITAQALIVCGGSVDTITAQKHPV